MRTSHTPPPADAEAEAIRAELEALGEDIGDASELDDERAQGRALDTALDLASRPMDAALHDALWHSPQPPPSPHQQAGLGLLHTHAPSAALDPLRSERLLRGLHARIGARTTQPDLDLIHDELLGLDIPLSSSDPLAQEQRNGAHLGAVLDAVRSDTPLAALAALPDLTPEGLHPAAYAHLHLVRAHTPHARLDPDRARALAQALPDRAAPRAKVIPLRARWASRPALLSAAAALLVALVLALIWSDSITPDDALSPDGAPVAQVELLDAQRDYRATHAAALERLTSTSNPSPPSRPGDHALRDLRHAQHTMLRARAQAARRRL